MRCSKCGAENPEGKRFCGYCGAPLEDRCQQCGADNPPGNRFCGDCGAALAASAISARSSSTPTAAAEISASNVERDGYATAEGERRHLAVLFSDLVGSTEIAAHLDPEDWRDIAAEYQRMATAAVTRFGGHVAKYLGDGLMAYFGWPQAHEDDAERAVRAGLAIVEVVTLLNGRLTAEYNVVLSVRVGIETGSVVMGQGVSKDADAFGDAPNVASRVQSAAEPNSVLITAAVHELVSGLFIVEDRGAHQLRGVEHPVQLYRAIQPTAARRRTHRPKARIQTPFVGRDDDLSLLLSRWERAREGEGQLALVIGEPGIGKSRLVEEFRTYLRDQPHVWVECAGEQLFQSTPFHAATQILNQGLGWRGDESRQERVTQLEYGLERAGLKLGEAVPLIAEILSLPIPDKYPALIFAPEEKRRRLLANLAGWVLNTSRLQPMVVAMEDLHWVDPSTLELTQIMVDQSATVPLMLLYTARPEFRAPWRMRAHHAQITLNRLNERHTREMIAGVVANTTLAPDLIDAVVKRTDGVPLFAEELTRLILEGEGRSAAREIPVTLLDSLTARLDRLGPAKEVAQVAAVVGREFSYELLRAIAPTTELELQSALARLADAELIYARGIPPEATYQFKHALIRDAAYEALLKSRRRELHRQVAQTITDKFAAAAEAQPEVIARHWANADEAEPAISAWRRAGDTAVERRSFKEAEEAYRQALAMLGTLPESEERDRRELELTSSLIQVLQRTRGYSAAETVKAAAEACALAEKSGRLTELVLQRLTIFAAVLVSGDHQNTTPLADELIDLARREGSDASFAFAHLAQIGAHFYRGDLAKVEEHFGHLNDYFAAARFDQFPGMIAGAYGTAALGAWSSGRASSARVRKGQAITAALNSKRPYELAFAQYYESFLYLFLREWEQAETAAVQAISLCDQHGFLYVKCQASVVLGRARVQLGSTEGMALIRQGLADMMNIEARVAITSVFMSLGQAQALCGNLEEALMTTEQGLDANPDELIYRPLLLNLRGDLQLQLEQSELAKKDFREAISLSQKMSAKALELRATTSLARLLRDGGRRDEARSMLSAIYNWFTEGFDTADLKDAKGLLDELTA